MKLRNGHLLGCFGCYIGKKGKVMRGGVSNVVARERRTAMNSTLCQLRLELSDWLSPLRWVLISDRPTSKSIPSRLVHATERDSGCKKIGQ